MGSGCKKGYVISFLKVLLAYLGITAAAVCTAQRPVELSENILQNLFHNLTCSDQGKHGIEATKMPPQKANVDTMERNEVEGEMEDEDHFIEFNAGAGRAGKRMRVPTKCVHTFNLDVCCQSD